MSRIALGLAIALTLIQAGSLVGRGATGRSDISVYYRASRQLAAGAGPGVYLAPDAGTGWPVSMPPIGYAIFQPFSRPGPLASSVGWALFNLGLLGVSVLALRRVVRRLDSARARRLLPWAVVLLLVLATGSLQVGQFSILIVCCWLLFLDALCGRRVVESIAWLALPATIKLYPLALLAVPVLAARSVAAAAGYAAGTAGALALMSLAVPAVAYGGEAIALNEAFWRHVMFSNAQLTFQQNLIPSNQSVDTVLLRYFTHDPAFHGAHPLPHLSLPRDGVLQVAHAIRVGILLATAGATLAWRRRRAPEAGLAPWEWLGLTALWCAALYLILPEAKSRYAIYTCIAFLPWLESAITPAARTGLIVTVLLVLVVLPVPLQALGLGVIGAITLWVVNLRLVSRQGAATGAAGESWGTISPTSSSPSDGV